MYYGFHTNDKNEAIGALLVYGIWKSRDIKKLKNTPDMYGMLERAIQSCAKRSTDSENRWNLDIFVDKLKKKLKCSSIKPKYMKTDTNANSIYIDPETGEIMQLNDEGRREFWMDLLDEANHEEVLDILNRRAWKIVHLVRDRQEREAALKLKGIIKDEEEEEIEDVED